MICPRDVYLNKVWRLLWCGKYMYVIPCIIHRRLYINSNLLCRSSWVWVISQYHTSLLLTDMIGWFCSVYGLCQLSAAPLLLSVLFPCVLIHWFLETAHNCQRFLLKERGEYNWGTCRMLCYQNKFPLINTHLLIVLVRPLWGNNPTSYSSMDLRFHGYHLLRFIYIQPSDVISIGLWLEYLWASIPAQYRYQQLLYLSDISDIQLSKQHL